MSKRPAPQSPPPCSCTSPSLHPHFQTEKAQFCPILRKGTGKRHNGLKRAGRQLPTPPPFSDRNGQILSDSEEGDGKKRTGFTSPIFRQKKHNSVRFWGKRHNGLKRAARQLPTPPPFSDRNGQILSDFEEGGREKENRLHLPHFQTETGRFCPILRKGTGKRHNGLKRAGRQLPTPPPFSDRNGQILSENGEGEAANRGIRGTAEAAKPRNQGKPAESRLLRASRDARNSGT